MLLVLGCRRREAEFATVVQDIQTGVIPVAANGSVPLPERFAGLTPRNEIFVERKPDSRLLVLFPTWYGRGDDIEGLLYCSSALKAEDFYTVDWGQGGRRQHIDIAGRDMLTVRGFKEHWYYVSRRID